MSMVLDGLTPRSRSKDPTTSVDAGRAANERINETQSKVLSVLFLYGPLADHQLVAYMKAWGVPGTPQKFRTARASLVATGKVEAVDGEYVLTENGHKAQVWQLVEDAHHASTDR